MPRFPSSLAASLAAVALIAGCQSAPKSSGATVGSETPPATDAVVAGAPHEVPELTNQKQVWECPKCGMTYDGPGSCTMDGAALAEVHVDYICPADQKPVEHAGKCPRCAANARVVKTAIAAVPSAGGGQ